MAGAVADPDKVQLVNSSLSLDGKENATAGVDMNESESAVTTMQAAFGVSESLAVPSDQASAYTWHTGAPLDPPAVPQVGQALIPDPGIIADSPITDCMARVLEIIPDVQPDYLTTLVTDAIDAHGFQEAATHVLHVLFEDSKYPKVVGRKVEASTSKRANDGEGDDLQPLKRPKLDYGFGDVSRVFTGGPDYPDLALV